MWRLTLSGTNKNVAASPLRVRRHTSQHALDHKGVSVPTSCLLQFYPSQSSAVSRKTLCKTGIPVLTKPTNFQQDAYILPADVRFFQHEQNGVGDMPRQLPVSNCPNIRANIYIGDPLQESSLPKVQVPGCVERNSTKEARQILKIRRKKMKRHLLKKYRKRMFFLLRKQRRERKQKKEAVFQAKLDEIQQWGESFCAREYVLEELKKARQGGFYINILDRK